MLTTFLKSVCERSKLLNFRADYKDGRGRWQSAGNKREKARLRRGRRSHIFMRASSFTHGGAGDVIIQDETKLIRWSLELGVKSI
ncbi:MAG: hypothetical protein EB015_06165 [Methylocystaceae bacterium]|nr:hypothetical protein [Methylocystaceae bacterium]